MVIRPSTTVSSTVSIRLRSLVSLAFTTASAAERSVMSRVIWPNPCNPPSGARMAVITTLARKREPSFRARSPMSLEAAGCGGNLELASRLAALDILWRIKVGAVAADNLVGPIAVDQLRPVVPRKDVSIRVEQQ